VLAAIGGGQREPASAVVVAIAEGAEARPFEVTRGNAWTIAFGCEDLGAVDGICSVQPRRSRAR
jgi:hypothetical protein